ncbi:hypothetical protein JTB14_031430 [Gonioctena quinquepunctata]|nr:hypothetical protein JTB14_031430 [Gonioctena quinquepunctata]
MEDSKTTDPYERNQQRLLQLFDGVARDDIQIVMTSMVLIRTIDNLHQKKPEAFPVPSPRTSSPVPSDTNLWEPTSAPIPNSNFDEDSTGLKMNIDTDSTVMEVFKSPFSPNILN